MTNRHFNHKILKWVQWDKDVDLKERGRREKDWISAFSKTLVMNAEDVWPRSPSWVGLKDASQGGRVIKQSLE